MRKYTEQAQAALRIAKEAAREMQQNYVGTEHLLLGLVKEENGTAGRVLAEMGVEESALRSYRQIYFRPGQFGRGFSGGIFQAG